VLAKSATEIDLDFDDLQNPDDLVFHGWLSPLLRRQQIVDAGVGSGHSIADV
jgi:hypothetical protein